MTLSLPDLRDPSVIAGTVAGFATTAYVFSIYAVDQMITYPNPVTGPMNFGSGISSLKWGLVVTGGLIICALYTLYLRESGSDTENAWFSLLFAIPAVLALAGIVLTIYFAPGNPANVLYPWHQTPLVLVALGGMIFLGGVAWKGILAMISSP